MKIKKGEEMYAPKIHLYVSDSQKPSDVKKLANMVRGLRNCYGGFQAVTGLHDQVFFRASNSGAKIVLNFQDVRIAHSFKADIDNRFAGELKARRVRFTS
ncbi:hypothetical protein [Candidatus Methylomicrobium oryzae]|uniref:hypothetical protein n=1 Tax=Candidatus Methylomicrobium oryzae TaxID=2802053 RepID=UPI0019206573|nr:hypothetical protein [Methylomicrobium sp. RS1]MBL1264218.1 hypothetical protein [Methylomicrobium sp. RS1]